MGTKLTPMATAFYPIDLHLPPNVIVDVHSVLNGDKFEQLVRDNPEIRMELTSKGELVLMSPTGSKTGALNFAIARLFGNWVEADGSGIGFDSSTMFVCQTEPGGHPTFPGLGASVGKR